MEELIGREIRFSTKSNASDIRCEKAREYLVTRYIMKNNSLSDLKFPAQLVYFPRLYKF